MRHDNLDGYEWTRYLSDLCDRLAIPRPCPAWSREVLRQCGRAHLVLVHVQALLDAEAASATPSRQESRRLRSEVRRSLSQRQVLERTLAKMAEEQRAREHRPPTVREILDAAGAHGR